MRRSTDEHAASRSLPAPRHGALLGDVRRPARVRPQAAGRDPRGARTHTASRDGGARGGAREGERDARRYRRAAHAGAARGARGAPGRPERSEREAPGDPRRGARESAPRGDRGAQARSSRRSPPRGRSSRGTSGRRPWRSPPSRSAGGSRDARSGPSLPARKGSGPRGFLGIPSLVWQLLNLGPSSALLWYFLRKPAADFFGNRRTEIAKALAKADEDRRRAEALAAELDERLARSRRSSRTSRTPRGATPKPSTPRCSADRGRTPPFLARAASRSRQPRPRRPGRADGLRRRPLRRPRPRAAPKNVTAEDEKACLRRASRTCRARTKGEGGATMSDRVTRPYVDAFFAVAGSAEAVDGSSRPSPAVAEAIDANPELAKVLANPGIERGRAARRSSTRSPRRVGVPDARGPPPRRPPSATAGFTASRLPRGGSRAARPRRARRRGARRRRARPARRRPCSRPCARWSRAARGSSVRVVSDRRPLSPRRFRRLGGQRAARRVARAAPRESPRRAARTRPGV